MICLFALCFASIQHTFWNVHGVQATQQISDSKSVPLVSAQPIVAGIKESEVWPVHVRHDNPVQEPTGTHARVIMLDSALQEVHHKTYIAVTFKTCL